MAGIKGFSKPKITPRSTFSMIAFGKTKVGKTFFSIKNSPGPVAVINFDRQLEDVLPSVKRNDIYLADLSHSVGNVQAGTNLEKTAKNAQAVEAEFVKLYDAALASDAKTIVVDKLTTLWELIRLADFGKLEQVKPHHYVRVNTRMRQYLLKHQTFIDKNFIFIEDVKEEWVNEKPTGRWVRDGFKHGGSLVHLELNMWREKPSPADAGWRAEVESCGLNAELVGWVFENDGINFEDVANMVLA